MLRPLRPTRTQIDRALRDGDAEQLATWCRHLLAAADFAAEDQAAKKEEEVSRKELLRELIDESLRDSRKDPGRAFARAHWRRISGMGRRATA